MPTNRRRRQQPRRHDLVSPRTVERLESGHDFALLDGPELSPDELADAWEELRETIMRDFIAKNPGHRPWAWWEWDSPAELRLEAAPGTEPVGDERWFGKPPCYAGLPTPEYESEADYLERHDLLTEAERKALGRPQPAADDGESYG